ncbi:MAG: glycosyltransferase [Chloroflexota bacterium]
MYVSVIVPMYNAEDTIQVTLDSLLEQTYLKWEAVLVDDGSKDQTLNIAKEYAASDSRFVVVSQENGGVCSARNTGIEAANHNWILYLDADDWIVPEYLEIMTKELMADQSFDAAYCGWAFITPDGHEVFKEMPTVNGDLYKMHAEGCPYAIHSFVIKKEAIQQAGGYDPSLTVCEDWDLWQRVSRLGTQFKAVKLMLAPYRMRASSASMDGRRILSDGIRVLRQGYTEDLRMANQITAHPNGIGAKDADSQEFYLMCSAAGLVIGRNEDARFLIDELDHEECSMLDPYSTAFCVIQSAMLSACYPLTDWEQAWRERSENARLFFEALESRTGVEGLADQAQKAAGELVIVFMGNLSPWHQMRAKIAHGKLLPNKMRTWLKYHYPAYRGQMLERIRNALQTIPSLYNLAHLLRRKYGPGENRAFFEDLFEDENPWEYTSEYEQVKYEQTLELFPEGPIESALEIACAEGHFTVQYAPRVKNLVAADISQRAIDRTAKRCSEFSNINYAQLDLAKDNISGKYDLITCSEMLYFMRDHAKLRKVAQKITNALNSDGYLIMAHGNVVRDDPNTTGFGWEHDFGAKGIGETFSQIADLTFVKEVRTPLYRIQLFQKSKAKSSGKKPLVASEVVEMEQPTELEELVSSQVLWHGCSEQLPVLMYHRVAPDGSDELADWRVTPEEFEKQLAYLQKAGFHSVTLKQWRGWVDDKTPFPKGGILITFDDGYRDFAEHAWPLLKKYGFTATVHLVVDQIGGYNAWDEEEFGEIVPLMNWDQIRELKAEGVTFGSHTVNHFALDRISPIKAWRELKRSKHILEEKLDVSIDTVAYPFGLHNRLVHLLAGLAGYAYGFTCQEGAVNPKHSMLAMPRLEVEGSHTLEDFKEFVDELRPQLEQEPSKNEEMAV